MSSPNQPTGRAPRRLLTGALAVLAICGVLFVGFLVFYVAQEPERAANPADVGEPEVPTEGVAVPDGGDLTSVPTQAEPTSPARNPDNLEAIQE